jgi:hypothetical protein
VAVRLALALVALAPAVLVAAAASLAEDVAFAAQGIAFVYNRDPHGRDVCPNAPIFVTFALRGGTEFVATQAFAPDVAFLSEFCLYRLPLRSNVFTNRAPDLGDGCAALGDVWKPDRLTVEGGSWVIRNEFDFCNNVTQFQETRITLVDSNGFRWLDFEQTFLESDGSRAWRVEGALQVFDESLAR